MVPHNDDHEPLLAQGPQSNSATSGSCTVHTDGSYSYSYGPPGLSGLRRNKLALGCALFASIGGFTFGFDQGVISNILIMKSFWTVGSWEKGVLTASLDLGALMGALWTGILTDRFSRRQSMVVACLIFCAGSTLQCAAQTLAQLTLGRLIGGVAVGMLSPLYMAEISPPEVRGSLMSLEQFSIVLGVVAGFWSGFFTRKIDGSMSWRIPLALQLIPGVLLLVGSFFLPPSPRLLVLQGKNENALNSLARLRGRSKDDPLLQIELLEMRVETTLIQQTTPGLGKGGIRAEVRAWARLFEKKYIDRTAIGVLVMFFQQWSGINALLYYAPSLMHTIGIRGDTITLLASGGIGIVQLLAVFPAIIYIDKLGRKPLLRGGSVVMCISHITVAILIQQYGNEWLAHRTAAWVAVACLYIFTAAYGVSFGPVAWVLPSEINSISLRSRGVALSTMSNWTNNFLIGLVTPVFVDYSSSGTFALFGSACFMAYLWSTYIVPETANISMEEMDLVFKSSTGSDDAIRKREIEQDLGLDTLLRELSHR